MDQSERSVYENVSSKKNLYFGGASLCVCLMYTSYIGSMPNSVCKETNYTLVTVANFKTNGVQVLAQWCCKDRKKQAK